MKWAKPSDYACAAKHTTNAYRLRLLEFLEREGYPEIHKLKKLLEEKGDVQKGVGG